MSIENKKDMPHWIQFVSDVLSGRYKELKEESKQYTKDSKEEAIGKC